MSGYQPKGIGISGSIPPCTGSLIWRGCTDTAEIDRVAIGVRLYDMFKATNANSKLHSDGEMYMHEKDINAMFQLVNNTDRVIRVYRP